MKRSLPSDHARSSLASDEVLARCSFRVIQQPGRHRLLGFVFGALAFAVCAAGCGGPEQPEAESPDSVAARPAEAFASEGAAKPTRVGKSGAEDSSAAPVRFTTSTDSSGATESGRQASASRRAHNAGEEEEASGGLAGLNLVEGPSVGPVSPGGASASGEGQLSEAQIQSTVRQHQSSVKRGCWQDALMTRDSDAPSTARVTVSISISPSGRVLSATAPSGDPRGYVGLASCITNRVRGWSFPPSRESTTVHLPFVFAAQ